MGMFRICDMNVRTLYTCEAPRSHENSERRPQVAGVAAEAAVVTTTARQGPAPVFA
jgi:hypothetical protein